MVDTLAPHGYAGRLRTTLVACATFAAGALAGGVATFGGLALLGARARRRRAAAIAVAAAVALAAAAGEARGARIVPQVRRQVPESWRRVLPVPLAAGLYGVLLGLGFTTFVLSFAVWALARRGLALGDPALGLLVGLGFGAGRALPVVVLAPLRDRARRRRPAAMAERPAILRALRARRRASRWPPAPLRCGPPPAQRRDRARRRRPPTRAPPARSSAGRSPAPAALIARPGGARRCARRRTRRVGGGRVAWSATAPSRSARRPTRRSRHARRAGADARRRLGRLGGLARARAAATCWRVAAAAAPSGRRGSSRAPRPARRSAARRWPATGSLFHVAGPRAAASTRSRSAAGSRGTLRTRAARAAAQPVQRRRRLLYVRSTFQRQQLRIGPLRRRPVRRDRALYGTVPTGRRDAGHEPRRRAPRRTATRRSSRRGPPRGVSLTLWSTALGPGSAYVTRLRQDAGRPVRGHAPARAPLSPRGTTPHTVRTRGRPDET